MLLQHGDAVVANAGRSCSTRSSTIGRRCASSTTKARLPASPGRRRTSSASTTRSSPRRARSTELRASRRSSPGSSARSRTRTSWPTPGDASCARSWARSTAGRPNGASRRSSRSWSRRAIRPGRLTRAWRRLERFEGGLAQRPVLFGLALGVYALVAVAFPLADGRDLGTYLRASFELRSREVVFPQATLGRAPITGLFGEGILSLGAFAAEVAMALLYSLSILCWWRTARRLGSAAGIAVAGVAARLPELRTPLPPARERCALRGRIRARCAARGAR